ncbi:MAG: LysM peptidoglycan-binding domain-containing protein [Lachnospirales bacterium]
MLEYNIFLKNLMKLGILVLVTFCIATFTFGGEVNSKIIYYKEVKVQVGDTFSKIAFENNTSNLNTYEFSAFLQEFNNYSSEDIYVGETIIVPIYEDTHSL